MQSRGFAPAASGPHGQRRACSRRMDAWICRFFLHSTGVVEDEKT